MVPCTSCAEIKSIRSDSISPGDLLLDSLSVGFSKQIEHGAAEVVGVAVGVAQLICDCVQEQVTP